MRTLMSVFLCLICLSSTSFAQHGEGGREGGGNAGARPSAPAPAPSASRGAPRNGGMTHSVFPAYNNNRGVTPPRGGAPARPAPVAVHEDHIGNRVSDDHLRRVQFANERSNTVMRGNPTVVNRVAYHGAAFEGNLHPVYVQKQVVFNNQFNHYHAAIVEHPLVWRDWHAHHFYGGFYYGFHPVPDMSIYFYNPLVHWFYIPTWDDSYYRTWYGPEYSAYPELNKPFVYYGVYYPTDNLRQLLFGVSAMPVDKQARFREGMIEFTQKLTQKLANHLHQRVILANGDIAVTHYETLGADDGVDIEGAVTYNGVPYDFKGLINLDENNITQVFIAGDEASTPSPQQLQNLDELNRSMDLLRGEQAAPPASDPNVPQAPEATQPTSGQVSADPQ